MVSSNPQSAKALLFKIVLWLPICFVIWYYAAPALLWPVVKLSGLILGSLLPEAIETLELKGRHLDVITHLDAKWMADSTSKQALTNDGTITFVVNILKYSYGVALYLAMTLAVRGSSLAKLKSFLIGFGVLVLIQSWGACFEIIKVVVFELGAQINQQAQHSAIAKTYLVSFCAQMRDLGCGPVSREVIALCYQLGYLILPAISPVLIWAFMNFNYLVTLSPGFGRLSGQRQPTQKRAVLATKHPRKQHKRRRDKVRRK